MNKIYEKQTWHNDSAPALSEDNLNHIENGIDAIDSRLAGLTPADIGATPNTRTVNGHALNADVSLSASDVGLGNVPNVSTNNQTPTFTEASARANITSGESLSTLFGKIKKWFSDLKTVALTGSYNDLTDKPTIPPGVIVDQTYDPTSTDAQSGTAVSQAVGGIAFPVTGVKGGNNGEYKTGNVNLEPFDIGVTPFNAMIAGTRHMQYYRTSHAAGWYDIARFYCDSIVTLHIEIFKNYGQSNQEIELNGFVTYFGSGDYENPGLKFEGVTQNITEYFSQFREGNEEDEEDLKYLQIKRETNDELVVAITPYYHARFGSPVANVTIFDTPAQTEMYDTAVKLYFTDYTGILGANYGLFGSLNVKSTLGEWGITADGRMSGNFDATPTANSTRIVTSGGVYDALTDGSVTKIGTGNVGSATQPVYINGGVPTAGYERTPHNTFRDAWDSATLPFSTTDGEGWYTIAKFRTATSTLLKIYDSFNEGFQGLLLVNAMFYNSAKPPTMTWLSHNWGGNNISKFRLCKDSGTGLTGEFTLDVYYGGGNPTHIVVGKLWATESENKSCELIKTLTPAIYTNSMCELARTNGDSIATTGNIRQAITTGTPTNINANLTLASGYSFVQKSGNVVRFRVLAKATAGTLGTYTILCKLPFVPIAQEWGTLDYGVLGSAFNHANWYMDTSGNICLAHGITLSANQDVDIMGTYMTNA